MILTSNNLNMINYSIIIPHKDIPALLLRCVSSIPRRSDTEIIIVDDHSNQNTKMILEQKLSKSENLRIIYNNENRNGGGAARNIGLDKSRGKWIIFADADDYFNYCIEEILDKYQNSNSDVIYFKGNSVDTNTYTTTYRTNHLNQWIEQYSKNPQKAELSLRYLFGEPWCKIIRKSLIDKYNIRFDEIPIHNDTTFSYLIGFHAKNIQIDNRALYCVTTREHSVSVSVNPMKELTRVDVFSKAESFFKKNNIPVVIDWHYRQCADFLFRKDFKLYKKGLNIIKKNLDSISYKYIYKEVLKLFIKKIIGKI